MKTYIYISGFLSAFFFAGWIVAMLMGLPAHLVMLLAGAIILFLVYLPLVIRKRREHLDRMEEIINNYKSGESQEENNPTGKNSQTKGWSMNDSPFRERRSGATWSGGNIHAANVTRGTRRSGKKR